jgi:hypothetical protein
MYVGHVIQELVNRRLNSCNAWYHSTQNLLSSRLLSKNVYSILEYKRLILSVVLYGCETWSLTLREEHRLRVLEGAEENIGTEKG